MRKHYYIIGSVVAGLFLLSACAGDAPVVRHDGGADAYVAQQYDTYVYPDTGATYDGKPLPDQYVWPDNSTPADTWPWPTDTYSGTPFGCKTDSDCFGKVCCATPWGVKLCADSCNP